MPRGTNRPLKIGGLSFGYSFFGGSLPVLVGMRIRFGSSFLVNEESFSLFLVAFSTWFNINGFLPSSFLSGPSPDLRDWFKTGESIFRIGTGFSRIFREFGVAVRSRMGRKGEVRISASSELPEMALKSNLKKQGNPSPEIKALQPERNSYAAENRKVHLTIF